MASKHSCGQSLGGCAVIILASIGIIAYFGSRAGPPGGVAPVARNPDRAKPLKDPDPAPDPPAKRDEARRPPPVESPAKPSDEDLWANAKKAYNAAEAERLDQALSENAKGMRTSPKNQRSEFQSRTKLMVARRRLARNGKLLPVIAFGRERSGQCGYLAFVNGISEPVPVSGMVGFVASGIEEFGGGPGMTFVVETAQGQKVIFLPKMGNVETGNQIRLNRPVQFVGRRSSVTGEHSCFRFLDVDAALQ